MEENTRPDSPHEVNLADSPNAQGDTSDSDDQFCDARSGTETPKIVSPKSKVNSSSTPKEASRRVEISQDSDDAEEEAKQNDADSNPIKPDTTEEHTREADIQAHEKVENGGSEDDFGDDFDDFEEGGGGDDGFADFDDDDFVQPKTATAQDEPAYTSPQHQTFSMPIPDFDGLNSEAIRGVTEDLINTLYPPELLEVPKMQALPRDSSVFINPRSASLWSQLVAPPPLAPPDWIRSRTRRLFLVSLGVPVDLDEILPASKQKKLILPSLNLTSSSSPRASGDARRGSSVSRLRQGDGNTSSTSVDSQGKRSASSQLRKGAPAEPDLDLVAARYLCNTTDEALDGMTDEELKAHVEKLKAMQETAKEALEYWKKRTDEKLGDREAFEGVIENLVKHARKVRK